MISKRSQFYRNFLSKFCWKAIGFALIEWWNFGKKQQDAFCFVIFTFSVRISSSKFKNTCHTNLSLFGWHHTTSMITDIASNFQLVHFSESLWMKWERLLWQEQLIKKVNYFFVKIVTYYCQTFKDKMIWLDIANIYFSLATNFSCFSLRYFCWCPNLEN